MTSSTASQTSVEQVEAPIVQSGEWDCNNEDMDEFTPPLHQLNPGTGVQLHAGNDGSGPPHIMTVICNVMIGARR